MGRDPDDALSTRRGRQVRRQRRLAGGHGDAVRRHRRRSDHDVDDHQRAGGDDLRDVPGRGGEAGRALVDALRHASERHPQGVHRAEGVHLSAAPVDAAGDGCLCVLRAAGARWNTISVSGYHIREAGATAAQELAFTLRNGIEYVQYGIDAGLDVDAFAPRISFFFNAHNDFFEEIAKFRAARRLWARVMRERFGATNPRSWQLRFHAQTAGVSLTAQQPYNNVVRTALQAMAAVLGGTQSLHTNALDEALALPTAGSRHAGRPHAADSCCTRPASAT